jgi:hypothetical protein
MKPGGLVTHSRGRVMQSGLKKTNLVRNTNANASAFVSWMSSAREAGENQPLEAPRPCAPNVSDWAGLRTARARSFGTRRRAADPLGQLRRLCRSGRRAGAREYIRGNRPRPRAPFPRPSAAGCMWCFSKATADLLSRPVSVSAPSPTSAASWFTRLRTWSLCS